LMSKPIKGRSLISLSLSLSLSFELVGRPGLPHFVGKLRRHTGIHEYMSDKIKAIHGDAEAVDFFQRHSCVIVPLALVSNGTRRVTGSGVDGLLNEDEKTELKRARPLGWRVAWNASYNRPLTPEVHIVVAHVPWFVDQYGIYGVFGEGGCEALHVVDSLCRKMVRHMRNPEARHKATKRTPFTTLRARFPQSHIGTLMRAERGAAAILVLARERGVEMEVASNLAISSLLAGCAVFMENESFRTPPCPPPKN
jgi:hypothetical protein